jgi:hypothetical protein
VNCVYYDKIKTDMMVIGSYHVAVDPAGNAVVLREYTIGSNETKRGERIPTRGWANNRFLEHLASDFRKRKGDERTPAQIGFGLFCLLANAAENASVGVQVKARKGSTSAIFNVDTLRTPYFFKDRNKTATGESGRAKPIFHVTRPHYRAMPDGTQKPVRMHFRGERKFLWHDYAVSITVPGLHHRPLRELTAPAYDVELINERSLSGFLDEKQVGQIISKRMDS